MKYFDWSDDKNAWLARERSITFPQVIFWIAQDAVLDIIQHPNSQRYPGQRIFVINIEDYVYLVPFVEDEKTIFLKTIIPSRKMTARYLGE